MKEPSKFFLSTESHLSVSLIFSLLYKHLQQYWSLWILLVSLLFIFPHRLGMKPDPSLTGIMSLNIIQTKSFWPLQLRPEYLPEFYDQTPAVVWGMALTQWFLPMHEWCVHLFSRICAFFCYLLVVTIVIVANFPSSLNTLKNTNNSREDFFSRASLALVLLTSWSIWLKFVSEAQFEASLTIAVLLLILAFFLAMQRVSFWGAGFVYFLGGFLGFHFKGPFVLPLCLFLSVWNFLQCRGTLRWVGFLGIFGFVLGFGSLYWLDFVSGTHWWDHYVGHKIMKRTIAPDQGTLFVRIGEGILGWLKEVFEFHFVWTVPFLVILFYQGVRGFIFKNKILLLLGLCYFVFVIPTWVSGFRLLGWQTSSLPIAALFLAHCITASQIQWVNQILLSKYFSRSVIFLILVLSSFPFSPTPKIYRGEDWAKIGKIMKDVVTVQTPVLLFLDKKDGSAWIEYQYSAMYFFDPRKVKIVFSSEVQSVETKLPACSSYALLVAKKQLAEKETLAITKAGWRFANWTPGNKLSAFYCVPELILEKVVSEERIEKK